MQHFPCCTNDGTECFKECCGCGNGGCCTPSSGLDYLKEKDLSEDVNGDAN